MMQEFVLRFSSLINSQQSLLYLLLLSLLMSVENKSENSRSAFLVSVDSSLSPESTCDSTLSIIKTLFQNVALLLYEWTGGRFTVESIIINIPIHWKSCGSRLSRDPSLLFHKSLSQLLITSEFGKTRVVQFEGCGKRGQKFVYHAEHLKGNDIQNNKVRELALAWLKYEYGVFDERGEIGSRMYPKFYQFENKISLTSCTNNEIKFLFDSHCLHLFNNCSVFGIHNKVTSSVLFESKHSEVFPNIHQICDSNSHNSFAPTPQNFLCSQRSVLDVIKDKDLHSGVMNSPSISFFQERNIDKELFIFFDLSLDENKWSLVFEGLQLMFIDLPQSSRLTIISQREEIMSSLVGENDSWWRNYFTKTNRNYSPLSLEVSYAALTASNHQIKNNQILILTNSCVEERSDSLFLSEIHQQFIKVDVVTFQTNDCSSLIPYTKFGKIIAVPSSPSISSLYTSYYIGLALKECVNDILTNGKGYRQSIAHQNIFQNKVEDISTTGVFDIPKKTPENRIPASKLSISILCSSFRHETLEYFFQDPSGSLFTSSSTDRRLSYKWSSSVLYVVLPSFLPGTWNFTILGSYSEIILDVSYTLQNELVGKSLMSYEGKINSQKRVPIYSWIIRSSSQDLELSLTSTVFGPDSTSTLSLYDDGLGQPDILKSDDVYSQYFLGVQERGYYSVIHQLYGESKLLRIWIGDSFYSKFSPEILTEDETNDNSFHTLRVTDLFIDHHRHSKVIALSWTSIGSDIHGREVAYYKIHCDTNRQNLLSSKSPCNFINGGTVVFANSPGVILSINRTLNSLGQVFYFGVLAVNTASLSSQMSNIVSVYHPNVYTTTTTTTTSSSTNLTMMSSTTTSILDDSSSLFSNHTNANVSFPYNLSYKAIDTTTTTTATTTTTTPFPPPHPNDISDDIFLTKSQFYSLLIIVGFSGLSLVVGLYLGIKWKGFTLQGCYRAQKSNDDYDDDDDYSPPHHNNPIPNTNRSLYSLDYFNGLSSNVTNIKDDYMVINEANALHHYYGRPPTHTHHTIKSSERPFNYIAQSQEEWNLKRPGSHRGRIISFV